MRGTIGLDLYGISGTSNLYHDHVSISAQLGNDSGFDFHRIDGLSPIKAVSKIIIKIEIREGTICYMLLVQLVFVKIKNGGSITEMINSINERRSIRKYQEGNVISCCFIIREKTNNGEQERNGELLWRE